MTDFITGLAVGIFIGIALVNFFLLMEPLTDEEMEDA